MIVKYSLRELKNNKKLYTFILIQLVITYFICIGCTSALHAELRQYNAFRDYYNREGWFITLQRAITEPYSGTPFTDGKDLEGFLKSAEVEACYTLGMGMEKEGRALEIRSLAYDNDIAESYIPELEAGRWFSEGDNTSDVIEAVISPNQWGIGAGDSLDMIYPRKKLKVKVVGVLENGTDIFDFNITDHMVSYRNLFYKADYRNGEPPVILMLHDDIQSTADKYGLERGMAISAGPVMVMYEDDITEKERGYNQSFLEDNSVISEEEELSVMGEKSLHYLSSRVIKLVPVLAGAFLLTLISVVSAGILAAKRQMKRLAVFHLLGLAWRRCLAIPGVSLLLLMAGGLLITIAGIPFLNYCGIWRNTGISTGTGQLAACLVLSLCYLLASCLSGICISGKNTITEQLCQEKEN